MARPEIWSIGGGKGGVGKTMLAANIAVGLAKFGKRVIVVDTDLGGANLHSYLGIGAPEMTIYDFFLRKVSTLDELLIDTPVEGLKILPGSNEIVGMANPRYFTKLKLMRHIQQLDAEYIILDVGAGTAYNTLDLFGMANMGLVVTIPEKPAIESAYGFIKASIYRKLLTTFQKRKKLHDLIDQARNPMNEAGIRTVHDLIKVAKETDPEFEKEIRSALESIDLRIIINFVQSEKESAIGNKMVDLTKKYLSIDAQYVGSVPFSNKVRESLANQTTLLMEDGEDEASAALVYATRLLLASKEESDNAGEKPEESNVAMTSVESEKD